MLFHLHSRVQHKICWFVCAIW